MTIQMPEGPQPAAPHAAIAAIVDEAVRAAQGEGDADAPDLSPDDPRRDEGMIDDGGEGPLPDEPISADPAVVARCVNLDQNDTDNGRRLLAHFGEDLAYVREIGWHAWTGQVWAREEGDDIALGHAQETARRIKLEAHAINPAPGDKRLIEIMEALERKPADQLSDEDKAAMRAGVDAASRLARKRKARRDFAVSSGNAARVRNMLDMARPAASLAPSAMDADPMLFNLASGTLRFSLAEREEEDPDAGGAQPVMRRVREAAIDLQPHARADRIAKLAPLPYQPGARASRLEAFLERFQPDPAARIYLQTAAGASLIGGPKSQVLIFLYGAGANGKSVFMEVLTRALGDYAGRLRPETLTGHLQQTGDKATPDLARLAGKRFVAISELPRGHGLKEGLIKALTGGEPMPVRHLMQGFFDMTPEFIPFMSGNELPSPSGLDEGIWRRLKFIGWPVTIPAAERRPLPEVVAHLLEDGPGLINWLVEGARRFLAEGLIDPPGVAAMVAEQREDLDPVQAFLDTCTFEAPGNAVQAQYLFDGFRRYCLTNGIRPWQITNFAAALKKKGLKRPDKMTRIRSWLDIGVNFDGLADLPSGREA